MADDPEDTQDAEPTPREDIIDTLLSDIHRTARDAQKRQADEAAGLGPPRQGTNPPGRRFTTLKGIGESLDTGFERGGESFRSAITSPLHDIPEGLQAAADAYNDPDTTVLGRLRRAGLAGLGVAQAVTSPLRMLGAPLEGAARMATEIPSMLAEYPDVPRSEFNESGRQIAQGLLELAGGIGVSKVLKGLRTAKGLGDQGTTSGRLLTGATEEPKRIPGVGETSPPSAGEGAPTRVYQAGPPGSVTGKPTEMYRPGLQSKDIAREAGPPDPTRFGVPAAEEGDVPRTVLGTRLGTKTVTGAKPIEPAKPWEAARLDVDVRGVPKEGGESALEAMRRRAKEGLDQAPKIVDDLLEGARSEQNVRRVDETLGQYLRRLKREGEERVAAGQPSIPDRPPVAKDFFAEGKPADMSLRDWVKLNHTAELNKVKEAATTLDDAKLAGAPPHIQQAVNSGRATLDPDKPDWLTSLFTRAKIRLPFSMTQIVKNDPVMEKIHKLFVNGNDAVQAMRDKWTTAIRDIASKVSKEDFEAGIAARDKRIPPANANQGQVATLFGKIADEWADALSLDPTHPDFVKNYVPRLRQAFKIVKTEIQQGEDWVSRDITSMFPKNFRPYFTKNRKLNLPGDNYSLDTMIAHSNAVARASVYGTPQHHGILNDLTPLLRQLKDRPADVQEFMANYINYAIGHPQFRSAEGAQKLGGFLRTLEFARTIGANVTSPIYNTIQRSLTFSEVGMKAFAQALRDEAGFYRGKQELVDLIKKAKIPIESLGPHKYETETVHEGLSKGLNWMAGKLGAPFGYAERGNRVHAFFSGYRNALSKGANEVEAIEAGRSLVQKTQFMPGPADKPKWMRKELGNTLGQFKYFQTKLGEYMWSNMSDMARRGATFEERRAASAKFLRFWGTAYALGGPQTAPIVGDFLDKIDPVGWKGLAPALGVAVRDQLGLGAVLPESLEALKYYIPGPVANHVMDVVNATTGFDVWNPGAESTVASRARAGTRAFPVAGIQLERLRRGGLVRDDATERQPQTVSEAFPRFMGGEGVGPQRPLLAENVSKVGRILGFQDPEMEKSFKAMDVINEAAVVKNRAKKDAAQALHVGDYESARQVLRDAEKQLGLPPGRLTVSPQSTKGAKAAQEMTPLERRRKAAGKELRNYGMEDLLQ